MSNTNGSIQKTCTAFRFHTFAPMGAELIWKRLCSAAAKHVKIPSSNSSHGTALVSQPNSPPGLIPFAVSNFYLSRAILILVFFSLTSGLPNYIERKSGHNFSPGATHSPPIANTNDLLDSFDSGKC